MFWPTARDQKWAYVDRGDPLPFNMDKGIGEFDVFSNILWRRQFTFLSIICLYVPFLTATSKPRKDGEYSLVEAEERQAQQILEQVLTTHDSCLTLFFPDRRAICTGGSSATQQESGDCNPYSQFWIIKGTVSLNCQPQFFLSLILSLKYLKMATNLPEYSLFSFAVVTTESSSGGWVNFN